MKQMSLFLVMLLTVACTITKPLRVVDGEYKGYKPIEPLPLKNVEMYDGTQFVSKPWAALKDSVIRDLLPNQSSQVAMRITTAKGEIKYLTTTVTDEAGSYEVLMDFMKYRVQDVTDINGVLGNGRIGIGLRVKATVVTNKANLNISGLSGLGVEASNNHLTGLLSIDIIGIDSKDITNYIPLTAKLDETSIQNALQAVATIKSKIWDNNVNITPHLIAIYQNRDSSEKAIKDAIVNGIYVYSHSGDIISDYWMPDNNQVNVEHETRLKGWMKQNGLSDISITYLINTMEMEQKRQQLINDLKLNANEN